MIMFYDYEFKTPEFQQIWGSVVVSKIYRKFLTLPIKLFFKSFEEDYLYHIKSSLAFEEKLTLYIGTMNDN